MYDTHVHGELSFELLGFKHHLVGGYLVPWGADASNIGAHSAPREVCGQGRTDMMVASGSVANAKLGYERCCYDISYKNSDQFKQEYAGDIALEGDGSKWPRYRCDARLLAACSSSLPTAAAS